MTYSQRLLPLFALFSSLSFADAPKDNNFTLSETVNGINFQFEQTHGMNIFVDGVRFSFDGKFHVVTPDWSKALYSYADDSQIKSTVKVTQTKNGGKLIKFDLTGKDDQFKGTQEVEIGPDRTIRLKVSGKLTTNTAAQAEFPTAYIPSAWLTNNKVTFTTNDNATITTTTPLIAAGPTPDLMRLATNFKTMNVESRYGAVDVQTTSTHPFTLLDYRKNPFAQGKQFYWFGVLSHPLKENTVSYEVSLGFPEKITHKKGETQSYTGQLTPASLNVNASTQEDIILPLPKKISWGKDNLKFENVVTYQFEGETSTALENSVSTFLRNFSDKYKITTRKVSSENPHISLKIDPTLLTDDTNTPNDERYRIETDNSVIISAATEKGFHNAFKTLDQLVRMSEDRSVAVRKASIDDWPSLPFRGIHFFTGKDSRDLQLRMVKDVLSPLKINAIIYQTDYIKWDSLPKETHHASYGMDKKDALAVANEIKNQGMELIPMVNTFGHSEWLLSAEVMKEYRDNPKNPYAYDPSHPEIYKICEKVYEEAIELFKPKTMHIGHDEIDMEDFPFKPENKAVGATKLVIDDILHYYKFFKNKGMDIMIWGDMFLAPGEAPDACFAPTLEEAKIRRDALPKDIIITDWHYRAAPPKDYKSLSIWANEGFKVIGSTWYAPDNIINQSQELVNVRKETSNSLGLLQTTWAGYSFDQNSFNENGEQYAAYLLAANAAWTGGTTKYGNLPFIYQNEFARMWNAGRFDKPIVSGWTLNMDKIANFPLSKDNINGLGLGTKALESESFGALKSEQSLVSPSFDQGVPNALLLSSVSNPKGSKSVKTAKVDVNTTASYLVFASAATFDDPKFRRIAQTVITYKDGSKESFDWIPGRNVFAMNDSRSSVNAPILQLIKRGGDQPNLAIYGNFWKNPFPDKVIKSVDFISDEKASALMLFGMSGIQEKSVRE